MTPRFDNESMNKAQQRMPRCLAVPLQIPGSPVHDRASNESLSRFAGASTFSPFEVRLDIQSSTRGNIEQSPTRPTTILPSISLTQENDERAFKFQTTRTLRPKPLTDSIDIEKFNEAILCISSASVGFTRNDRFNQSGKQEGNDEPQWVIKEREIRAKRRAERQMTLGPGRGRRPQIRNMVSPARSIRAQVVNVGVDDSLAETGTDPRGSGDSDQDVRSYSRRMMDAFGSDVEPSEIKTFCYGSERFVRGRDRRSRTPEDRSWNWI